MGSRRLHWAPKNESRTACQRSILDVDWASLPNDPAYPITCVRCRDEAVRCGWDVPAPRPKGEEPSR